MQIQYQIFCDFLRKYCKYKKKSIHPPKKRTECRRMPHSLRELELKLHENINFDPKKHKLEIARFMLMCYLLKRNHLLK